MTLWNTGKKEEPGPEPQPNFQRGPAQQQGPGPVGLIIQMKSQGMSNNQIIQNLQQQGFSSDQIFNAMNQAEARSGVDNVAAGPVPFHTPEQPQQQFQHPGDRYETRDTAEKTDATDRIEEIAEAIIDEKWKELTKNIRQITEWKDTTEARINQLIEDFKILKTDFNALHSAILGKVGEYDHNIVNLGTEIKAMETVFKKLLPTFSENVNELSELTKKLRKIK